MRTLIAAAILAALLVPGSARAGHVSGTVMVPTGTLVSDGNARPERCAYQADPAQGQGVFGWVITEVTPGAQFWLRGNSDLTADDLGDVDIDFLHAMTTCDQDANKTAEEHDNRTGDEHGIVPEGATSAIVTLRTGVNVPFTYHEEPFE